MKQDNKMKRHNDYYEYKHVSFDFYNRVKNKHEFKKEWVSVRCPEDILQLKPSTVEVRRLKKNVWHNNNNCDNLYNCRANGWLLLKWEGLRMNCELCNSVGWIDTFNTQEQVQEIQKCDDCNIFKTDKEAQEEVQQWVI